MVSLEAKALDTQVTRLPKSQVELSINLSAEEVDSYFAKVYRELAQRGQIPGFRPGKAPPLIVRRFFGAEQVKAATWMEIVQDTLEKALKEHEELKVVGDPVLPDIEEVELDEGKELAFSVILSVYPKAEVHPLGEVKLVKLSEEISDEEIDKVLEELREDRAEWVEVSRAAAPGDKITVEVATGEREAEEIQLIAEQPDEAEGEPALVHKVVGRLVGQTVTVELPAEEGEEERTEVKATIKKIEEKKLPELNDEFASQVSEFDTLEELREHIRQRLREQREEKNRERLQVQVFGYLVANADVEVPDVMLAQVAQGEMQELEESLAQMGASIQELAEAGALDPKRVEENVWQRSLIALEARLATDAVMEKESLEVEDEDIEAAIKELAQGSSSTVEYVRQAYELHDDVREEVHRRARTLRVIRWVVEQAQIEELDEEEFEKRYKEIMDKLLEQREQRRKEASEPEETKAEEAREEAAETEQAKEEADEAEPEQAGEAEAEAKEESADESEGEEE